VHGHAEIARAAWQNAAVRACLNNHDCAVIILLKREDVRAHVNTRSGPRGVRITALHAAVRVGSVGNIARVLKYVRTNVVDHNGLTPQQLLDARREILSHVRYMNICTLFTDYENNVRDCMSL
jgi:hypothetical protein